MADTIATITDMRHAGNLGGRVSTDSLTFYLDLTSYIFREMISDTTYDKARNGQLDGNDNDMLKKAEALLAVGFSLPAIATHIVETGMLKIQTVGSRGGDLEAVSFAKEVMELAANFLNMAQHVIPTKYVVSDSYKKVWFEVVQRVFPALDEMPTIAQIGSYAEGVIQKERGDEVYVKGEMG